MEYQPLSLLVCQRGNIKIKALFKRRLTHHVRVNSATIIRQGNNIFITLLTDIDADTAGHGFARNHALIGRFDTVVQRIANHMLQNNLAAVKIIPVQTTHFIQHTKIYRFTQLGTDGSNNSTYSRHQARYRYYSAALNG